MAFGDIVAHLLIAISIGVMGAAISRAHKLITIIKNSKAESVWKPNLILLYLLTLLYIVIMITRLFTPDLHPLTTTGAFHNLLMNTAFLMSSIVIYNIVNLEIDAFDSFFTLLEEEDEDGEVLVI